jgi:hypothetical protein
VRGVLGSKVTVRSYQHWVGVPQSVALAGTGNGLLQVVPPSPDTKTSTVSAVDPFGGTSTAATMYSGLLGEIAMLVRAAFASIITGPHVWPLSVERHTEPLRIPANQTLALPGEIVRSVASAGAKNPPGRGASSAHVTPPSVETCTPVRVIAHPVLPPTPALPRATPIVFGSPGLTTIAEIAQSSNRVPPRRNHDAPALGDLYRPVP